MDDPKKTAQEFTRYYEEYKQAIFNYLLYRLSYDRDQAEDLTSEVFIKAYEHFDSYDTARSFKTWVFTIAHNHLINHLMGRKQTLSLDEAIATEDEREGTKSSASNDLHTKWTIEMMLSLVDKLPDPQKQLIVMRYVNDLSNSEIAGVLGKDEGAIRTGLSRAIGSLRNLYSKELSLQIHG